MAIALACKKRGTGSSGTIPTKRQIIRRYYRGHTQSGYGIGYALGKMCVFCGKFYVSNGNVCLLL